MIKTSVIIPIYNTALYLEECIHSVFRQTQKEVEVIAINDGSTDGSLEILLRLQEKYPELIIMTQENHGLGYTRNVGIKRARGQYIFFLDSDDYIQEDTLEECYECASKNNLDIVFFDALEFEDSLERSPIEPNYSDRKEIITEREEVFSGVYFLEKYYKKSYAPMSCLIYYDADFLSQNDILFMPDVYFEDNEFYCKVMTIAERIMYLPRMFYQYRCRKSSITGTDFNLRKARDHIKVVSAIADLKDLNEGKGWHIVRKISLDLLKYVAEMCYKNSLYCLDGQTCEVIFCTWMKICGCNIEDMESLEDIEYIYRICTLFPNSDLSGANRLIYDKRSQLLIKTLRHLQLDQRESKVAIYGCGKYTDQLLDFYTKNVGTIKADIIFLNSYMENAATNYRGYSVYYVGDIKGKNIDYILISSLDYEEEMNSMICQFYGDRFRVIKLYGDLHINIL